MERLPPLNALRVFHAVGHSVSIRQAAETLNVAHTAVARHIKELENWFDRRLVETTSRGTVLNADGRRLHAQVSDAFQVIAHAAGEIRPAGRASELRVWGMPGFATFWLLPRLPALQHVLPRVSISLLPTEQLPSFENGEVDVAIRYGRLEGDGLVNVEVDHPRVHVLASHRWIREHPEVTAPEHLLGLELMHERRCDGWIDWFSALGLQPKSLPGPKLGVLPAVLEAVHQGRGPGLIPDTLMDDHVLRNNLQPVVAEAPRLRPYVLVFRHDRAQDKVIQRFVEWMRNSLSKPCLPEAWSDQQRQRR